MSDATPLTDLIRDAGSGDEAAMRRLFDVTYAELRQLARLRLKGGGRGTLLDTTALVHESYLRFAKLEQLGVEDRRKFFAYASKVMRSVIVDFVRERVAVRRGGGAEHVTLDTAIGDGAHADGGAEEILRVHEALSSLAQYGERLVRVVEMRYFAGMT
ncbi:MAG TPA: ECF-type sigma factor, partial [Gammaproteobacteria bacterium]|nr:ECF-type sigma factor [Gammaproteobacteria bacterium]